mgnify:CR=1 FL=1
MALKKIAFRDVLKKISMSIEKASLRFQNVVLFLLIFFTTAINGQKNDIHLPVFKEGETIVFFGNSITHGGTYHTFINLYYKTRFPEKNIKMINCGVAGDQIPHGIRRFETDVLVHNPDIIVMMFGMNDSGVHNITPKDSEKEKKAKLQSRIDNYQHNLDSASSIIANKGIRMVYIAPTIYDDVADVETPVRYGGNKALGMCRDVVFEIAEKYQSPVVDFYTIMNAINARYQPNDPSFTVVGKDRVHPGKDGHLLMAYQFLKSQQAPGLISEISLDASKVQVIQMRNCTVEAFSVGDGVIYFTAKSIALPFPVSGNEACNWVPVNKAFNNEILQISGLVKSNYALYIDDDSVGVYTQAELADGINLALNQQTPQYKQALLVSKINDNRTALVRDRIRSLAFFDYGFLKNMPVNQPLDSIAQFFEKELVKIEDKPYYPYVKEQTKNYLMFRPQLHQTKQAVSFMEQSMHLSAQPIWHKYKLVQVDKTMP